MASLLESDKIVSPVDQADFFRIEVGRKLDPKRRSELGQYLTPKPVAYFMASLFNNLTGKIRLLDPGAGTGILTSSFLKEAISRKNLPETIDVDLFEIEPLMQDYLKWVIESCLNQADEKTRLSLGLHQNDFINWAVNNIELSGEPLFRDNLVSYTHCIMNPPYKKIRSDSNYRKRLRDIGIETGNLYSGFLALAVKLLADGGELVAIVPRSFCNGPYFRPFRELLLSNMILKHLHLFESRNKTFKDDKVLQENIIFHAVKNGEQGRVTITSSISTNFEGMTSRTIPFEKVVKKNDPDSFIHIAANEVDQMVIDRISVFNNTLYELGMDVCTGPVVDFRLRKDILMKPFKDSYPLIYPGHFVDSYVEWPNIKGKKPNAIQESEESVRWLMDNGWYVLTKRFSAKEEKRRIVATLHSPERVKGFKIGFENHLNVFHKDRAGLEPVIAKGLALYLNSTLLDLYFRQFSGHTQVNATDLRSMHYPDMQTLAKFGEQVGEKFPSQEAIDNIIDQEISNMTDLDNGNPILIQTRIEEGLSILEALGLPRGQLNERSALTLLALVDLKPENQWREAGEPLMGITPIMDYIRDHYGKRYAPNTRETIRRQTMHQFMDAGIAVANPDKPDRPINSPKWCYQISPDTLVLLRSFSTKEWEKNLECYLKKRATLAAMYAKARDMQMIPLVVNGGKEIALTPGKHSKLIRDIIAEFGPRFAPKAEVLYVGDTGSKLGHFDKKVFRSLDLRFDSHGKFPDVVLYMRSKNWLLLIEAVTSHGPVDAKRHTELANLFAGSKAGIIYVTAFPNRQLMARYLGEISWETEVWVADTPSHLIHFDGEKFLGPY